VTLLERRRQEYLQLGSQLPRFTVVDASRPLDEVAGRVVDAIREFQRLKCGVER
jgi:thymidylate kinase